MDVPSNQVKFPMFQKIQDLVITLVFKMIMH